MVTNHEAGRGFVYRRIGKRLIDLVLSAIAIVALALPMLVVAVAIKCDSRGPVLFKQKRVGIHKSHFTIYKFRTMRTDTPHDAPTHLLENPETYITRIGGFLRKASLDELPQLFNIFLGHMSIVGPRPALWNQFDLIEARDACGANDVRPGLTGWAQINGRDVLSIADKVEKDKEYVERLNFVFDCRCVFGTVTAVLNRRGVVEGGTGALEKETATKYWINQKREMFRHLPFLYTIGNNSL